MNKFRWSMVSIIVAAAVLAVIISLQQNAKKYEATHNEPNTDIAIRDVTGEIKKDKDLEEHTSENEQVLYELGLGPASTAEDVMKTMHSMTHQKVISEEKWYNLEMAPKNINAVYEFIKDSDIGFTLKRELLKIAGNWKEGNFDNIVEDHNYLWGAQSGNVGKATGVLTPEQEAEFVKENF